MRNVYETIILKPAIKVFYLFAIALSVYLLTTPYYQYAMFPFLLIVFLLILGQSPELGFYLIVFMIPYGALRVLSGSSGSLTISKLLGLWVVIIVLCYSIPLKRYSLNLKSNMWLWLLAFFAISFVSALFSDYYDESFHNLRKLLVAYIFLALTMMFISHQDSFKRLTVVLTLSICFSALLSIIGYGLDLPIFVLVTKSYKRLTGTTFNPNHFAFMLIFSLPLLVHWVLSSPRKILRVSAVAFFVINGIGIILTYSRGGAIVLTVVLFLTFAQHLIVLKRRLIGYGASFAVMASVGIYILMPSSYWDRLNTINVEEAHVEGSSISGRMSYLYAGWDFFKKNPVLGSGPGTFDHLYPTSKYSVTARGYKTIEEARVDAHNTYLEVFVGTGILGVIVFLTIIWLTLKNFHMAIHNFKLRGKQEMVSLVVAYRLSFLSILTYFFMLSRLDHKYFWLSVALSQVALKLSKEVKLPALPRGASVAKPSGTTPKPPGFTLRATPRSPVAIPARASARDILAKASDRGKAE